MPSPPPEGRAARRYLDQLRAISDAMEDGLVVFDATGQVVAVNEAEARLCGYPDAAAMMQSLDAFSRVFELRELDGRVVPVEEWPAACVLRGEAVRGRELLTRRTDTGAQWVIRFDAQAVRDESGALVLGIVISSDVTARRRAEESLRQGETRFRLALAGSPAVVFEQDSDLRYSWVYNPIRPAADIVGRTDSELLAPEEAREVTALKRGVLESGVAARRQISTTFAGRRRYFDLHLEPARASDGRVVGLVGTSWEITERVRLETELGESERRFRALADSMPQLVWIADPSGRVEYYNARASEYGGLHREPDGGWRWELVVHPEDLTATERAWKHAVDTGVQYVCEHRVRMADGSFRWHLSRATLVREDARARWFGTATDIDAQKLVEADLRHVAATRDQMISVLAHDLRNPLGVMRISLPVLRGALASAPEGERRAQGETHLARIERQIGKLSAILDELLDLAALKSGRPLRLVHRLVDLAELARELVAEQPGGEQHPVELRAASVVAPVDAIRIERVLGNLLSNAIKYSPAGTPIAVEVGREGEHAVVRVRDQGIGIAEGDRERIFEWYARGVNAENTTAGTGIGLAGARRIVEQHGGRLTVESELGAGSTFTVRLPVRLA